MSRRRHNLESDGSGCPDRSSTEPTSGATDEVLPTAEHFEQELEKIRDSGEIQEALAFCKHLFEREEKRAAKFESKATTLMAFGALTAAFVSGFAALLLDEATAPCPFVVRALALAYALLVASFASAIYCGLKALVPRYITIPAPGDILKLAETSVDLVRRKRAAEFYRSYLANRRTTNRKGSWVMGAQISVACGMAFLLIIALVLTGHLMLT